MSRLAIKAEGVGKKYNIKHRLDGQTGSLKELLNAPAAKFLNIFSPSRHSTSEEAFWALCDVSFDVEHGESIGIIGKNGAGKSTLLKILSRITRPTTGRVVLYERVNSLLEIGTGFNTELSGRDNIFLNGSFLGMKKTDIAKRFDTIVDFSGIEQFIDTPVKYYSSGMFVRLAFSVAVHLEPELLLLDEILSVGDADFRQKSYEKMLEMLRCGATIILVSHNDKAIKEICKRAIWLNHGRIEMDGLADLVVDSYANSV